MLLKLDKDEMAMLLARLKGQSQGQVQVHKIENAEESDEYVWLIFIKINTVNDLPYFAISR